MHFSEGFIQVPVANSKELYGIKFKDVIQGEEFYMRMVKALGKDIIYRVLYINIVCCYSDRLVRFVDYTYVCSTQLTACVGWRWVITIVTHIHVHCLKAWLINVTS